MKTPATTAYWFFNLKEYPLSDYARDLAATELYPGRRILHEKLEERFEKLQQAGISHVQQLADELKSKKKLVQLAADSGVDADYLTMLNRQLHMLKPKPVRLSEFPGLNERTLQTLSQLGIINTLHFFQQGSNRGQRKALSKATGLSLSELNEITKLADISRIHGCGPVFCRMFVETGIDSVEKIARSDAQTLYNALTRVNEEKQYTKANFTLHDLEMTVEFANRLPNTVEV